MTFNQELYDQKRKEFYKLWFLAGKAHKTVRESMAAGKHPNTNGALSAFHVLSRQAHHAYRVIDRLRPPRPAIIDVAVEEDLPPLLLSEN